MERPCKRQQQLIAEIQGHLIRLAELARHEVALIESNNDGAWLAVDRQIEEEIGKKERCMGALREHRKEHGC